MMQGERRVLLAEGTENVKDWSQAQGTCGTTTQLGGPQRGAAVGEVRLERTERWGADRREAQRLCSETINLVTGGEWSVYSRGQGDPNPNP